MTQFARPTPAAADYDSTIIGALELSEKKWVLAVQLPGVNRRWEAVRRCAGLEGLRLYGLRPSSRARALRRRRQIAGPFAGRNNS